MQNIVQLEIVRFKTAGFVVGRLFKIVTAALAGYLAAASTPAASAQSLPTVGVYDEPSQANGVDFVAVGSTLSLGQFATDVAAAFNSDFGGVYQCEAIGNPFGVSYGVAQTKILKIVRGDNTTLGVTSDSSLGRSISGQAIWVSINPEMMFLFDGVVSGIPDERVVGFGLTILSRSSFGSGWPLGEVTATAQFSGGDTASSSRQISEGAGLGDTFFGFEAPDGQSIASVTFTSLNGNALPFDDIGFITAAVPEPSVGLLGACALCLWLGFRTIRQQAGSSFAPGRAASNRVGAIGVCGGGARELPAPTQRRCCALLNERANRPRRPLPFPFCPPVRRAILL